jgi:hypothetical protein
MLEGALRMSAFKARRNALAVLTPKQQEKAKRQAQSDTGSETSRPSRIRSPTWMSSAAGSGIKRPRSSPVVSCSITTAPQSELAIHHGENP